MKKRRWTSKEKLMIVLEGVKDTVPLAELCSRYQISQSLYYQWRDKLFTEGLKIFEHGGADKSQQRLEQENQRLKRIIGDLTVELKKSDF